MEPLCNGSVLGTVLDFLCGGWVEVEGRMMEKSIYPSTEIWSPGSSIFLRMQAAVDTPISIADDTALQW